MKKNIVVIGAGAGGLAAAIDLAVAGCAVTVVESALEVGGKMNQITVDDKAIDTGPTVFTMRWVFEQLFAHAGGDIDALLDHRPLTTLARHWWSDGASLELDASVERSAANISEFAGAAEAHAYRRFCKDSAAIYATLEHSFMAAQKPSPLKLAQRVGWRNLGDLLNTRPHQNLWAALGTYFRDPRLQQLFGRYATYVGSSPLLAPATLMLIAHVEQHGVWQLSGGMASLARAMAQVAQQHGATFKFGSAVSRITQRGLRVSGVELASGEVIAADAVVYNGDYAALATELLTSSADKPRGASRPGRGLSAVTWSGLAHRLDFPLSYHNVFFDHDYPAEFARIFAQRGLPDKPTVYLCAQDRGVNTANATRPETERLLVLINAPADGDTEQVLNSEQAWQSAATVLASAGLTIDWASPPVLRNPQWYHKRFPSTGGSLYGMASHGMWSSFRRPGAAHSLRGLYLCGGSVHPGPGVPMATLSGRLAASALLSGESY